MQEICTSGLDWTDVAPLYQWAADMIKVSFPSHSMKTFGTFLKTFQQVYWVLLRCFVVLLSVALFCIILLNVLFIIWCFALHCFLPQCLVSSGLIQCIILLDLCIVLLDLICFASFSGLSPSTSSLLWSLTPWFCFTVFCLK